MGSLNTYLLPVRMYAIDSTLHGMSVSADSDLEKSESWLKLVGKFFGLGFPLPKSESPMKGRPMMALENQDA